MSFGGGFHPNSQSTFHTPQSSGGFAMTGAFGSSHGPGGFGQTTMSAFFGSAPASSNSGGGVFGGNTSSQLFGSFGQQNRGFGSSSAMVPFGGSGSTFAMQTGPTGIAPDGSQGTQGRAFERTPETTETGGSGGKAYLMTIVAMKDFVECQPEMLRAADYRKGHRRSSGQVQTLGSSPGVFGGGFGGTSTPSGGSSPFNGSGGFRGSSGFGMSSAGIFGQSTPQPASGIASSFGQAGSSFGQQASSGGFGSTFGTTGSSIFGGSSAFGQQSNPSVFGSQQSRSSIFGNQPASGFGSSGFGQKTSSSSGGLFGQSSTSVFGSRPSNPFGGGGGFGSSGGLFAQQSSGGLFGAQASGGFASGVASSSSIFGNFSSGSSIFGQQSSASIFSGFGQPSSAFASSSSLFQSQTQPQSLFGPQTTTASGGSLFPQAAASQPSPSQQMIFVPAHSLRPDPTTHPNWFPEWGIVAPDPAEVFKDDPKTYNPAPSAVSSKYTRFSQESKFRNHLATNGIQFVLDDNPATSKKSDARPDLGWESFTLSRPSKISLVDEIKESIRSFSRPQEAVSHALSLGNRGFDSINVLTRPDTEEYRQAALTLIQAAHEGQDNVEGEAVTQLLPKLIRVDYYIAPSIRELKQRIHSNGRDALKSVSAVEIGRLDYGKICFEGNVNLEGLDIDEALFIRRGRIEPGTQFASLTGIPAVVTLFKAFSKNKIREGFLKSGAELMQEVDRFKRHTRSIGGEFVSYDRYGTWVFKVKDIRYGEK